MNKQQNRDAVERRGYAVAVDGDGFELWRYHVMDGDPIDAEHWAQRFSFDAGYGVEPTRPGSRIPDPCRDISIAVYLHGRLWSLAKFVIVAE